MDIKIARDYEYTPEWNDNKKDTNPIVVKLRYLTPGERDDCYAWEGERLVPSTKKMFLFAWISAANLSVSEDSGKPKSTWKGQEILDTPGLEGLYAEVALEVLKQNARRDLKN